MKKATRLENIVLTSIAKGATAELKFVLDNCDDPETIRPIYAELNRLAAEIGRRYHFEGRRSREIPAMLMLNQPGIQ